MPLPRGALNCGRISAVKLTIWQFVALIGVLVAGWLIYDTWFSKQDQGGWIRNWNNSIQGNDERVKTQSSGTQGGGGDAGGAPAEPPANVW
jgi:hypothetical protein